MTGLAAQQVMIGDDACRRLGGTFAEFRPRLVKRVIAFFTDGKDHPSWNSAGIKAGDREAAGVTVRVNNAIEELELRATIAVDVGMTAGGTPMISLSGMRNPMSVSTGNKTFRDARRKTAETLVHELWHVLRNWGMGTLPGGRRNVFDELHAKAYAREGYNNAFEREAFAFAGAWIRANAGRVDQGVFDDILPIDMIRTLAPK